MTHRKRPRYYVVKKGVHAYWEPKKTDCERYGLERVSLGHDGFGAMAVAEQHNKKLDALRQNRMAPRNEANPWPRGSFGKFWWKWSHRPAFYKRADKTQQELRDAWKRIGPKLGNLQLRAIMPSDIEAFVEHLNEITESEYVRWRTILKLRQMLNAAVDYQLIEKSPAGTIENSQPDGRTQIYSPAEIDKLIDKATELKQPNMALAIRVMYAAALSPVDARTLTLAMIGEDKDGPYIHRERKKVEGRKKKRGVVMASIPADLFEDLKVHVTKGGAVTPLPNAVLLVSDVTGKAWRDAAQFAREFAWVRDAALPGEELRPQAQRRVAMDIRRTANKEAHIGGASPEERAKFLANSMDTNSRLHATYTPPDVLTSRKVQKHREDGRKAMRDALEAGSDSSPETAERNVS
ncbi:MAG: hypothetical protein GC155_06050 [Alphaproteobacteria bacterium]|nr:hypothetical protein [Alphaproteobacteria bacterium]